MSEKHTIISDHEIGKLWRRYQFLSTIEALHVTTLIRKLVKERVRWRRDLDGISDELATSEALRDYDIDPATYPLDKPSSKT